MRDVKRGPGSAPGWESVSGLAVVSAGSASGIAVGMKFHPAEGGFGTLTVRSVEDNACLAAFEDFVHNGAPLDYPMKGLKLSTEAGWLHTSERSPFRTKVP